jgi:hypothetical protein
MLSKNTVITMLDSLPDDFSLDQIVEKLEILDKIDEGIKDTIENRVLSTDQVMQKLRLD